MTNISQWLHDLLAVKMNIDPDIAGILSTLLLVGAMIAIGVGINWLLQYILRWFTKRSKKLKHSKWNSIIVQRRLGHHILLLIPGIILYLLPYMIFERDSRTILFLHKADIIFIIIVSMRICNALMLGFLDFYRTTDKNKSHPLQGLIQVLQVSMYFVGGIIITAILIDKSPTVLLTGLGASAAVLMLIFKDSILGFVAGVQLSQNNMVKIGDWIQTTDGSANGNIEEITLNTIKVRNWDNTLTMIPPYTLVSTPFRNWRGMQESGGRRVDKNIFIDITTLEYCSRESLDSIHEALPLMRSYIESLDIEKMPINIQLYRTYIEMFLRANPEVNSSLDIIVTQRESTAYGLPIEVYFFLKDKAWASYERKQSDIFDHLMAAAPVFGLRMYQRP
ncbi:MAG: mechanosensitive ion channel [Bacteroidales bacterium]|nr:mechanosensitive ion channel [Bacteroidales bacterium]